MTFADPFELNFSKVKAYLNCPHLYKYIYLERKYAPHTPYSSLGISVHRALAAYSKRGGDFEDLLLYYDECWHHHGFAAPAEMMDFHERGKNALGQYWKFISGENRKSVLAAEGEFEFEFERWRVRGTIDRLDSLPEGGCEIIDYKMGFEIKTQDDLRNDLQLGMYGLGVKRGLNLEPKSVSWVLLMSGEKITIPYDAAREEEVLAVLRDTGEKLLALDLSRKGRCEVCSIRHLCTVSDSKPQ